MWDVMVHGGSGLASCASGDPGLLKWLEWLVAQEAEKRRRRKHKGDQIIQEIRV